MSNIVDFNNVKEHMDNENKFLDLLDIDIDINNDNVSEITESTLKRIANIKHLALLARQKNECLEM